MLRLKNILLCVWLLIGLSFGMESSKKSETGMGWFDHLDQRDQDNVIELLSQAIHHHNGFNQKVLIDMQTKFGMIHEKTEQLYEFLYLKKPRDISGIIRKLMQMATIKRCTFITKFLNNSDLLALKLASKELANTVDDDLMKERYEEERYKPVLGETKITGPSFNYNHPGPIIIAHRIPGPGRVWIVGAIDPTPGPCLKMAKIRITGPNTFEYVHTDKTGRYVGGAKMPKCGTRITQKNFTVESCWDGMTRHNYFVNLRTKNNDEYATKGDEITTSQPKIKK